MNDVRDAVVANPVGILLIEIPNQNAGSLPVEPETTAVTQYIDISAGDSFSCLAKRVLEIFQLPDHPVLPDILVPTSNASGRWKYTLLNPICFRSMLNRMISLFCTERREMPYLLVDVHRNVTMQNIDSFPALRKNEGALRRSRLGFLSPGRTGAIQSSEDNIADESSLRAEVPPTVRQGVLMVHEALRLAWVRLRRKTRELEWRRNKITYSAVLRSLHYGRDTRRRLKRAFKKQRAKSADWMTLSQVVSAFGIGCSMVEPYLSDGVSEEWLMYGAVLSLDGSDDEDPLSGSSSSAEEDSAAVLAVSVPDGTDTDKAEAGKRAALCRFYGGFRSSDVDLVLAKLFKGVAISRIDSEGKESPYPLGPDLFFSACDITADIEHGADHCRIFCSRCFSSSDSSQSFRRTEHIVKHVLTGKHVYGKRSLSRTKLEDAASCPGQRHMEEILTLRDNRN